MSEIALTPKSVVLRVPRGADSDFRMNGTDDLAGTCSLVVYNVGSSTPAVTIVSVLDAGDFVFTITAAATAGLPAYGRFEIKQVDSGSTLALIKGPFYCEGV